MIIAKEPHCDFVKDKENDPHFEFLMDANLQKLQEGYKPAELGSQQFQSMEGSARSGAGGEVSQQFATFNGSKSLAYVVFTFRSTHTG